MSKNHTAIPNGTSEDEDSSGSEDELKTVQRKLKGQTIGNENSSSSEDSDSENASEDESSDSKNKKKKKRLHWVKEAFVPPMSTFVDNLPSPLIDDEDEPVDYFLSMFGAESIAILTEQSNLYSVQSNPNRPLHASDNEIRQFIGILIMSGIYSFPNQRLFWAETTRVQSVASAMSRDRFLQIKKNLHAVDNTNQLDPTDPGYDRAFKVRPLLNVVKQNFLRIPKEQHLSVDEQMIPFKGRSVMKQHMPKKPHRWGYKMFVIAGGESGICYDFTLYTGKSTNPRFGFCTDIVLDLCETVPRMMNHKIYTDNYFTTIRLQVELMKLGIFSVGTVRTNRLPDVALKEAKQLSRDGRGSSDHGVVKVDDVKLCATRWYDNSIVTCLSTLHGPDHADTVKRWSAREKKHINVSRPNVIKAYNQYMGGVDLSDMLISLYRINIRSKKYYMKIIFHLIDLSIVNAWLMYRRHCCQVRLASNEILSLLQFRMAIAESLLIPLVVEPIKRRGRPSAHPAPTDTKSSKKRRSLTQRLPSIKARFDGLHHWPIAVSRGRCRYPGCQGVSTIRCSKCQIRLCLNSKNNCFKKFHQ